MVVFAESPNLPKRLPTAVGDDVGLHAGCLDVLEGPQAAAVLASLQVAGIIISLCSAAQCIHAHNQVTSRPGPSLFPSKVLLYPGNEPCCSGSTYSAYLESCAHDGQVGSIPQLCALPHRGEVHVPARLECASAPQCCIAIRVGMSRFVNQCTSAPQHKKQNISCQLQQLRHVPGPPFSSSSQVSSEGAAPSSCWYAWCAAATSPRLRAALIPASACRR